MILMTEMIVHPLMTRIGSARLPPWNSSSLHRSESHLAMYLFPKELKNIPLYTCSIVFVSDSWVWFFFYPNIPQLCLDNIIRYNNVCRCLPLSGAGKIQSSSHLSAATRQKIPRQFFVQQILRRRRRLWMKLWLIWVRLKEIRKEPLKNSAFHGPQCVLGTGCDQDSRTIVTIVTKGVIWDEPATNAADLNLGEFESQKKLIGSGYCVEPAELSACIRLWAHEFNG